MTDIKTLLCYRENVTNLMDMAQFLKQNGTEDFKVYSDTMCAIYRGVRAQNYCCCPHLCIFGLRFGSVDSMQPPLLSDSVCLIPSPCPDASP